MTVTDVRKECNLAFTKADLDFNNYNIEVTINNRLKRTLGKCIFKRENNKIVPIRIEISGLAASSTSKEDLKQIIFHECAHAITSIKDGEMHHHDKMFKNVCLKIGASFDEPGVELKFNKPDEQIYKYTVTCSNCGGVGHYHRAGKVVKYPHLYNCSKCGGSLSVTQNF